MNNSETIVKLIKELMKQKGVSNKQMSENVQNININTIAQLAKGREISYVSLANIADYLNCSVDYLLGRVDTPNGTYSINNHNTTISGTQANVINNTAPDKPDNITEQFFEKFETLSFEEKVDTMQYVNKNYKK